MVHANGGQIVALQAVGAKVRSRLALGKSASSSSFICGKRCLFIKGLKLPNIHEQHRHQLERDLGGIRYEMPRD